MPAPHVHATDEAFHVPLSQHLLSGFVERTRNYWKWLGRFESWSLQDELQGVRIDRPVYVAGLARSGSTILLEALAAHSQVVTHQYRDFPLLFTPYWWRRAQRGKRRAPPTERAHADGLMVTPESPEAMEEVLWMAFFPDAHDPRANNVLSGDVDRSDFEQFYCDHIRKLLLAGGGRRYASKENYNLTRLAYLQKLFPGARFIVPIRQPLGHIASLMKQHRLFTAGETKCPRALRHMQRVGHFEFGLDRRPINAGDPQTVERIIDLWDQGDEVRGWAAYWAYLYGWLADQLAQDDALRDATMVIRFEDLCNAPEAALSRLFAHCELEDGQLATQFAARIHAPSYYRPEFNSDEETAILEETEAVAQRFRYATALQCQ